jgi:NAD(P)-dependent dehydrogenase (short-subunit alcohol dehydrogenase family)
VGEIEGLGGTAVSDTNPIGSVEAAEAVVRSALDAFGDLDVLVNNAGILRDKMLHNMSEEDFDKVINVHLKGTWACGRAAVQHWRPIAKGEIEQGRAQPRKIINVTSASGLIGAVGQSNYAAAKMGIVGLTYSAANSLGRYGVTANAISPGASTRMTDSIPTERQRVRFTKGDERSPDNVAPIVAYLASAESGWVNGQVIRSMGYEVSLYNIPQPISTIIGTEPWDQEDLNEQVERAFGPILGKQG